MDITEQQQDQIEEIIALVDSPKRGVVLTDEVNDDIVNRLGSLVAQNPDLRAFLLSVKETVSARNIKAWASSEGASMSDTPWSTLAERLKQLD